MGVCPNRMESEKMDNISRILQENLDKSTFRMAINMLGEGTPRTNNGLEGSWPTIHVFLKGIITPIAMLDDILEFIIPYFERNKKTFQLHSKPFSLDERKYAVALSRETSETWLQYSVDKIQWNYCRKRLNGIRTPLTIKDVQDYEEKINQKNWNYEDFCFVTS